MRSRVERDPASKTYRDLAITPVVDAEGEALEMFELNQASRTAVEKARRQASRHHKPGEPEAPVVRAPAA
jgi:hypothetical protein